MIQCRGMFNKGPVQSAVNNVSALQIIDKAMSDYLITFLWTVQCYQFHTGLNVMGWVFLYGFSQLAVYH